MARNPREKIRRMMQMRIMKTIKNRRTKKAERRNGPAQSVT